MRPPRRIGAGRAALLAMPLLGMAAARGGVGQLATPRSLIELCVASAESGAQGLPALAKPCPGIEQAVRGLELGPLLPADWTTRLTPQSLSDWNALSARYSAAAPGERLSATALQVIARDLRPPAPSPSWWERFKAWVRRHLGPAINEPPQWLQHLSWAAGRGTQLAFLGVVLALVIAMIAVVTYRELRAEGLLGRRSRKPTATAAPQPSASVAPAESSEALDSLPVRERPVYLLRLILETLIRSHRLELAGPLTCRELILRARFDSPHQRYTFREIALAAECARFGPLGTPAELAPELLERGQTLREELAVPAAESVPA